MGTLTYPTPIDNLSGNHDRIMNLESRCAAAKHQPHDLSASLAWPNFSLDLNAPRPTHLDPQGADASSPVYAFVQF